MQPKGYLILHHVSKRKNIQNLLESAKLFGIVHIFIVRQDKNLEDILQWTSKLEISVTRCNSLVECQKLCRQQNISICGVEILKEAKSVSDTPSPFTRSTAFLMGNEGSGMNEPQMAICDQFVYIPQYGGGTASLNVTVAGSIIFHRFSRYAASANNNSLTTLP